MSGKDSQGNPTGKDVLVARSTDGGNTWKVLPPLPGTTMGTAAFSVVASAGNGHIGILYYRTPAGGRADAVNGTWSVVWAETLDANAASPRWNVRTIETGVHKGRYAPPPAASATPGSPATSSAPRSTRRAGRT